MNNVHEKLFKEIKMIQEEVVYTGWGMTKTREILKRSDSDFTIRVGNRLYVNKKLFDDYLVKCAKNKTDI